MAFLDSRRWISKWAIVFSIPLVFSTSIWMISPVSANTLDRIWQSISNVFTPKRPVRGPRGRKGPEAIISPGVWVDRDRPTDKPTLWNLKPVILYQRSANSNENATSLQLIDVKTQDVIQSFELGQESHMKLVLDKPLKPGTVYQINQLKDGVNINGSVDFRTIAGVSRKRLNESIQRLEEQGRLTPMQLSEEKIKLFVHNQLWSDALQELSQWATNEEEWKEFTVKTIDDWRVAEARTPEDEKTD